MSEPACFMRSWLSQARPVAAASAETTAAADEATDAAAREEALAMVEVEKAAAERKSAAEAKAAVAKEQYYHGKQVGATSRLYSTRTVLARPGSTFQKRNAKKRRLNQGGVAKRGSVLSPSMRAAIATVTRRRQFKRSDILGGDKLNNVEWNGVKQDHLELRKVYIRIAPIRPQAEPAVYSSSCL